VVPDLDRVGFASFSQIRIGIQGIPIQIGSKPKQMKKLRNLTFLQIILIFCKKIKIMEICTGEKDKTL
jgi:hypothetical protein